MAQLDMSLEELKQYKGTNPCPKDLDSFWAKALAELDSFDWNVSLKPADFKVPYGECFHLTFTGVGGVQVYAKYIRPNKSNAKNPALMQFHGYKVASRDWSDLLHFVAAGFSVALMDCRGQGGKSHDKAHVAGTTLEGHIVRGLEDGPDQLMYRSIYLDTVQLARILMNFDEVDQNRVAVTGGSQGGGLSLACAALEPRIAYVGAYFPFLSDYKRVWDMDLDQKAYAELRAYFRWFDPHHEREEEIFRTLGYIDVKNLAPRIKAKVLLGLTMMDDVTPPSTQFAAYNNILSSKEAVIYHDYGHEDLPGMQDRIFQHFMEMLDRF